MERLAPNAVSTDHIDQRVLVSGVVDGYPKAGYVRLVCDEGPRDKQILVDRRDTNTSFPRGETVTVQGIVDTELDVSAPEPRAACVIRL